MEVFLINEIEGELQCTIECRNDDCWAIGLRSFLFKYCTISFPTQDLTLLSAL